MQIPGENMLHFPHNVHHCHYFGPGSTKLVKSAKSNYIAQVQQIGLRIEDQLENEKCDKPISVRLPDLLNHTVYALAVWHFGSVFPKSFST